MKKLDVNKLATLSKKEQAALKGGNTFCEWYVGFSNATGTKTNSNVMGGFMVVDNTIAG